MVWLVGWSEWSALALDGYDISWAGTDMVWIITNTYVVGTCGRFLFFVSNVCDFVMLNS